jgi:hypothetical protein
VMLQRATLHVSRSRLHARSNNNLWIGDVSMAFESN